MPSNRRFIQRLKYNRTQRYEVPSAFERKQFVHRTSHKDAVDRQMERPFCVTTVCVPEIITHHISALCLGVGSHTEIQGPRGAGFQEAFGNFVVPFYILKTGNIRINRVKRRKCTRNADYYAKVNLYGGTPLRTRPSFLAEGHSTPADTCCRHLMMRQCSFGEIQAQ